MFNNFDSKVVYSSKYSYCNLSIADLEAIDREFPSTEADIEFMQVLTSTEYSFMKEVIEPMRIVQISHSIFRLDLLHQCMRDEVLLLEHLTAKNIQVWQELVDIGTECECISETVITILTNLSFIIDTIADYNNDLDPQGVHSQLHLFEDTSRMLWKNYTSFIRCFRSFNSHIKNIDLQKISESFQEALVVNEHRQANIISLIKMRSLLRRQADQLIQSIKGIALK